MNDIPFVEMKDLSDGQRLCCPSAERELSGGARFNDGDTLFARITPCLENGKICQIRGLKNHLGFGSTEFFVFRGKDSVSDNDFVYYLSRWDEVRAFAETLFRQWFVEEAEEGLETKALEDLIILDPREKDMKYLSNSSMSISEGVKRTVNSGPSFRNGDTLLAKITPCLENGKTGFVMNLEEDELARARQNLSL